MTQPTIADLFEQQRKMAETMRIAPQTLDKLNPNQYSQSDMAIATTVPDSATAPLLNAINDANTVLAKLHSQSGKGI